MYYITFHRYASHSVVYMHVFGYILFIVLPGNRFKPYCQIIPSMMQETNCLICSTTALGLYMCVDISVLLFYSMCPPTNLQQPSHRYSSYHLPKQPCLMSSRFTSTRVSSKKIKIYSSGKKKRTHIWISPFIFSIWEIESGSRRAGEIGQRQRLKGTGKITILYRNRQMMKCSFVSGTTLKELFWTIL